MKRMTTITVIAILIAVTQAQAGWLSNIGQRIVNGAINTVQTNISGKVNRTIDNAMDGKLAPQQKNSSQSHVDEYSGHPGLPNTGVSAGGPAIVETQESTYRGARGKAIPSTGKYEQIDLGITKFIGERIYVKELALRQIKVEVDEFLDPGYYAINVKSDSITSPISVMYEHEREGITFGYGIEVIKRIYDNGPRELYGNKNGMMYVVQVLPGTQGHLELTIVNDKLLGSGQITIFKIPGPTLK